MNKKKLSIILLIAILLYGCATETNTPYSGTIAIKTDEYTVTLEEYPLKVLGSGFLITHGESVMTGQLLPEDQREMTYEKAVEQKLIVMDEADTFVYYEGGTIEDTVMTYTVVSRIDDKYSFLISYTNLEVLLDIVQKISFTHATVTEIPTPTSDPNAEEEEVHNHEH